MSSQVKPPVPKTPAPGPPPRDDDSEFDDVDLKTRATMQKDADRLGESGGRIAESHAGAHPFLAALFTLKMFLGMLAAMLGAEPLLLLLNSADPVALQLALFILFTILWLAALYHWYVVRLKEQLIALRARGYSASERGAWPLSVTVALMFVTFLLRTTVAIVQARAEEPSDALAITSTVLTFLMTCAAAAFAERHARVYVLFGS